MNNKFCKRCNSNRNHYKCYECSEYTLCLGCSHSNQPSVCEICTTRKQALEKISKNLGIDIGHLMFLETKIILEYAEGKVNQEEILRRLQESSRPLIWNFNNRDFVYQEKRKSEFYKRKNSDRDNS